MKQTRAEPKELYSKSRMSLLEDELTSLQSAYFEMERNYEEQIHQLNQQLSDRNHRQLFLNREISRLKEQYQRYHFQLEVVIQMANQVLLSSLPVYDSNLDQDLGLKKIQSIFRQEASKKPSVMLNTSEVTYGNGNRYLHPNWEEEQKHMHSMQQIQQNYHQEQLRQTKQWRQMSSKSPSKIARPKSQVSDMMQSNLKKSRGMNGSRNQNMAKSRSEKTMKLGPIRAAVNTTTCNDEYGHK